LSLQLIAKYLLEVTVEFIRTLAKVTNLLAPGDRIKNFNSPPASPAQESLPNEKSTFARSLFNAKILQAEDIASAILDVLSQPDRVKGGELLIRPLDPETLKNK
jgi:NADP-dependent 3-hydroxy acid dehydrogenase YdfG